MHGQTYKLHPPRVAVVMIGTNDLGAAACFGYEHNVTAAAPAAALRQAQAQTALGACIEVRWLHKGPA